MGQKTVAIIDDDPEIVNQLKLALSLKEIRVIEAMDGLSGLKLIRKEKPDLILLDLLMPKLDGYKLSRLIRYDDDFSHIPIIAISHFLRAKEEDLTYEVGVSKFFEKPIDTPAIIEMIEELLL